MAKKSKIAQVSNADSRTRSNSNLSARRLIIRNCPVDSIRLDPLNPRQHSQKQIRQIADSIRAFGFNVPVLIDHKKNVIAGHGRLLACKLLGMTEVPTISLGHLSPHQMKAFMIADNKLTENGAWDSVLLGQQLKVLSEVELDFSLEATGFEMGQIDVIVEGLAPAGGAAQDPAETIPLETTVHVTATGDLWQLGKHRLLCGDALDPASFTRLMGNQVAAVVFTDPPYNVPIDGHAVGLGRKRHNSLVMASGEMSEPEFTDFLSNVCNLLARHSRDGSIHFICMDWRHIPEMLAGCMPAYRELKSLCVWAKSNAGMGSLYRSQHEFVFVFKHGKGLHRNTLRQSGRYRSNLWQYPGANSFPRSTEEGNLRALRPTVKPVAMVADAIMDCSARGDIVLDPFLGSGTTVMAAERTGRFCYAIEINPNFVDTIIRRWQIFTGLSAKHAGSGRSFRELEEEVGR